MIIRDVFPDQTAQMDLIEDDYVIEHFPAAASDPAFRNSILPRACGAGAHGFHATLYQHIGYIYAELGITIQDRIAVGARLRECLSQLLHYPRACRVFRNIEMEDFAPTMFNDEKAIQDPNVRVGTVKKSMAVMISR